MICMRTFPVLLLTLGFAQIAWAQTPTPTPIETVEEPELPEQVRALRQKVLESKARLLILPEEVHGVTRTASALKLSVHNELTTGFRLRSVHANLDGNQWLEKDLADGTTATLVHNSPVAPGAHKIELTLTYVGHGYKVFRYMNDYEVIVTSAYTFVVPDDVEVGLTARVTSDNPLKKHWKQRPNLTFELEESPLLPRMVGAPPDLPDPTPHTPQDPDN